MTAIRKIIPNMAILGIADAEPKNCLVGHSLGYNEINMEVDWKTILAIMEHGETVSFKIHQSPCFITYGAHSHLNWLQRTRVKLFDMHNQKMYFVYMGNL